MRIFDIKIGISTGEGKTFWQTIGTVFASDDADLTGIDDKPATFVMNFPKANGIIVLRGKKEAKK